MPPMDPLLARWRADTPAALAGRVHLNNAGAALMPAPVHDEISRHLRLEMSCGGYEAADAAGIEITRAYDAVAALLGTHSRNIAVVGSATEAYAQALSAFDFEPGDIILTTRNDYISTQLMFLSLARRAGVEIVRADDVAEGGVDVESVRAHIRRRRPKLVSLTWIPTNSGLVQPAEAVGAVCAEAEVPYLVDACQAVGQITVDVSSLHCDFLAATARKFLRGPRGTGFLYVSDRALAAGRHPLLVDMRGARWIQADQFELENSARRFESWEFAYALVLGLGEAARYAASVGIEVARERSWSLAAYTRERLAGVDRIRVLDRGTQLSAIVTAEVKDTHASDVVTELREWGINTSWTAREYAVLDMDDKHALSALRVSPHYYNTREEIDMFVRALT
jgi:selenocysteine lyase/cysteine desulfurase